jgi:hypothetical protein
VLLVVPILVHGDVDASLLYYVDSIFPIVRHYLFVWRKDTLFEALSNPRLHTFAPVAEIENTRLYNI